MIGVHFLMEGGGEGGGGGTEIRLEENTQNPTKLIIRSE